MAEFKSRFENYRKSHSTGGMKRDWDLGKVNNMEADLSYSSSEAGTKTTKPETIKEYSWEDWDKEFEEAPTATSPQQSSGTVEIDSSVKSDAGKTVVNYLMKKGLSQEAAIGAAKVFKAESGIIPGIRNKEEMTAYGNDKAGIGIAQWSNKRRQDYQQYMNANGYTTPTLENELDFFIEEGKSRPAFWNALTNAKTVQEAVDAMYYGYENGTSGAMASRDQIVAAYSPAYQKLYNKQFDIDANLNARYQASI